MCFVFHQVILGHSRPARVKVVLPMLKDSNGVVNMGSGKTPRCPSVRSTDVKGWAREERLGSEAQKIKVSVLGEHLYTFCSRPLDLEASYRLVQNPHR